MRKLKTLNISYRKGQVVIEYSLLLVCVVAVAFAMLQLVDLDLGNVDDVQSGGAAIQYWRSVIEKIGSDI